jgi:hypothetical protein
VPLQPVTGGVECRTGLVIGHGVRARSATRRDCGIAGSPPTDAVDDETREEEKRLKSCGGPSAPPGERMPLCCSLGYSPFSHRMSINITNL